MAVSGVVSAAISLTKLFTPSTKLLSEFYKNINLLNTNKNIVVMAISTVLGCPDWKDFN